MRERRLRWPATALVSGMAALTTFLTLLSWAPFAERSSGYLSPILFGCILVALVGMGLRGLRWHPLLVLLTQVAVLFLWLQHQWAAGPAAGGWLPTTSSLAAFGDTLRAAVVAAGRYAAPVPHTVPQFYPVMIVIGLGVAVLVDLLAAGLRRAPLAGLPLLAAYTAPVSMLDGGVSWLKFALAAMSFLFLIASEEAQRLAHWGHQLSPENRVYDSQATEVRTGVVWSSARKIGMTATALAVVTPLLVPTISGGLFDGNGDGPGGKGDAVAITNPMVDMKRDLSRGVDVELVRVTTTDPDPSYLRISVLDSFDGTAWSPSGRDIPVSHRADGPVPPPPGLDPAVPTRRVGEELRVSPLFQSTWLPAPYPVASLTAPGDWRYDTSTLDFLTGSDSQNAAGLTYSLQQLKIEPTADQLNRAGPAPGSVFGPETALPTDFPESLRRLAREVTAGATTKFEMAVRLQRWFQVDGHFTYSLQRAPGNGIKELEHFLGTGKGSRTGYCEQFAGAMATLGRSLGIPSRVAVGFLRPSPSGAPGTWIYSAHDMHAWPEMYFDGVGWVRFEPTPQTHTGESLPAYTLGQVGAPTPSAFPNADRPTAAPNGRFNRPNVAPDSAGGGSRTGAGSTTAILVRGGIVLVLLVLVLLLPRAGRSWTRARRWAGAGTPSALAEAAWAELRATAIDLGVAWDDRVSVRSRARDLARAFGAREQHDDALARAARRGPDADPEASAALARLVELVERARYSRGLADEEAGAAVRQDVLLCRDALRAGAGRRQRARADWFPESLPRTLHGRPARRTTVTAQPGVDRAT
ncbi:MAG: transglutaminaseTgpA domain-containing protein [Nocardioidaceae bacterium]